MPKTLKECKATLVQIAENENLKASEVIDTLTDLHRLLFKRNNNSITLTIKHISENMEMSSPITKTDFKSFSEDLLTIFNSDKEVNFTKYNYLPWLHYLKTGECADDTTSTLKGTVIEFPGNRMDTYTGVDELSSLLKHLGVKNTALVYGVMLLMLRR